MKWKIKIYDRDSAGSGLLSDMQAGITFDQADKKFGAVASIFSDLFQEDNAGNFVLTGNAAGSFKLPSSIKDIYIKSEKLFWWGIGMIVLVVGGLSLMAYLAFKK
jgi:hypothetical protein